MVDIQYGTTVFIEVWTKHLDCKWAFDWGNVKIFDMEYKYTCKAPN